MSIAASRFIMEVIAECAALNTDRIYKLCDAVFFKGRRCHLRFQLRDKRVFL